MVIKFVFNRIGTRFRKQCRRKSSQSWCGELFSGRYLDEYFASLWAHGTRTKPIWSLGNSECIIFFRGITCCSTHRCTPAQGKHPGLIQAKAYTLDSRFTRIFSRYQFTLTSSRYLLTESCRNDDVKCHMKKILLKIFHYAMPINLSASSSPDNRMCFSLIIRVSSLTLDILSLQLGLPGDCQLEFVNGGHGIKNPLAIEGQRQAVVGRDEERTTRPTPGKVRISLIKLETINPSRKPQQ